MIYFAYPGDLETATGGYRYDRRLIAELQALGFPVRTLSLKLDSVTPSREALSRTAEQIAAIPNESIVLIDGLAFGVMDEIATKEVQRLRLVALCHHPLALETGLDASLKQSLLASERRALQCVRAIVVTSENTRDVLIDQFGIQAESISVALPGTDRVDFASCDGYPLRLLTVASLTRRKAHDVLIDALAKLESFPWQARFVGGENFDPEWAQGLREKVSAVGLKHRIEFAGAAEDVAFEYQKADIFVLPSRFEGYGMVFAEALMAGLPIVATRAGAVPDVVPHEAGILVAPEDVDALAEALRQLLTDEEQRKRLQAGARAAAASLPSWADTAAVVAGRINEVVKQ